MSKAEARPAGCAKFELNGKPAFYANDEDYLNDELTYCEELQSPVEIEKLKGSEVEGVEDEESVAEPTDEVPPVVDAEVVPAAEASPLVSSKGSLTLTSPGAVTPAPAPAAPAPWAPSPAVAIPTFDEPTDSGEVAVPSFDGPSIRFLAGEDCARTGHTATDSRTGGPLICGRHHVWLSNY